MDTNLVVAGIPVVLLIVAAVQALKEIFKIEGQKAAIAALLIGQLLALAMLASRYWPIVGDVVASVVLGLVASLSAMGVYSGQKALRE